MKVMLEPNTNILMGRELELNLLTKYFENSNGIVAVITGPAGIGKTYLAKFYAEAKKSKYSNFVWWRGNSLPKNFELPFNTLLIIDEADIIDNSTVEAVKKLNKNIRIIIIGQVFERLNVDNFLILNLQPFTQVEALSMIKCHTNAIININENSLKLYVENTKGNPALLSMTIELINKLHLSSVNNLIFKSTISQENKIILPNSKIETPTILNQMFLV